MVSTLADVISGLLEPTNVTISVDGKPLRNKDYAVKTAYVTQDTFLFNESVRDNLTWMSGKAFSDSDLWNVLVLVGMKTVVQNLGQGSTR